MSVLFCVSCGQGHVVLVERLLDAKASVTAVTADSVTPAMHAALNPSVGSVRCLEALMKAGAPLLARDSRKQTLWHGAARVGNVPALKYILAQLELQAGASRVGQLNAKDRWSRTALHWAILNGHLGAMGVLLSQGASPNARVIASKHAKRTHLIQEPPLLMAARVHGEGPILRTLLEHKADPNIVDDDGHGLQYHLQHRPDPRGSCSGLEQAVDVDGNCK